MANLIHKLIKKPTPPPLLRIITTTFNNHAVLPSTIKSNFTNNSIPLLNPTPIETVEPNKPFQFYYPNFPFGYCLNPVSTTGFDQMQAIEGDNVDFVDDDDARTLWSDSVKKKRKRKMNKHKYKKLRKRLRKKT